MASSDPVAIIESLGWFPYLFGGGGITAIVVAWLGSKRPAPPASPSPNTFAAAGIGALLADHMSIDRLTNEIRRLADANERLSGGVNRYCDLMDIAKALERLQHQNPRPPEPPAQG